MSRHKPSVTKSLNSHVTITSVHHLVLVNAKNANSMKLGQFGNDVQSQKTGIHQEMDFVILGVKAGKEKPGRKQIDNSFYFFGILLHPF